MREKHKYGRFITFTKYSITVRVPNCEVQHFNKIAIDAAVDYRNQLCKKVGRDPYEKTNTRKHTKIHEDKIHSDLPIGITRGVHKYKAKNGEIKEYPYVQAIVSPNHFKSISTNNVEESVAVKELISWRKKKKKELNKK